MWRTVVFAFIERRSAMLEKLLGYGLGFRSPGDVVSDAAHGELP
jgi:hypothetical protein